MFGKVESLCQELTQKRELTLQMSAIKLQLFVFLMLYFTLKPFSVV